MNSGQFKQLAQERIGELLDHFSDFKEPWQGFPHIYKTQQFDRRIIEKLVCDDTMKTIYHLLSGTMISYLRDRRASVVTYFYEASTRTRMSFERAAHLLGATVIGTEAGGIFSSAVKGETLADTVRVLSGAGLGIGYADLIIIRHKVPHIIEKEAIPVARVPIINAGDGTHQHPTQALLDLATIYLRFGKLDRINIAIVGDIKYSRTIRSLCYLLSKFDRVKIYLVSPEELRVENDIRSHLDEEGVWYREETDLNKILPLVDIIYFTRLQAERFIDDQPQLYEKLIAQVPAYSLLPNNINLVPENTIVLHPLPIGDNEINEALKKDPRIWAFIQTDVGVATRIALINRIFRELGKKQMHQNFKDVVFGNMRWA